MTSDTVRFYIIPTIKALVLHAVVLGLFVFNWESQADTDIKPQPKVINAKVLTMADPIAAKKEAKKKAEAKRKAEQKRQQKKKREEAKRKEAERKKAEEKRKKEQQRKAEEKRKAKAKKKAEADRKAAERKAEEERKRKEAERLAEEQRQRELEAELEAQRELEISRALDAEDEFLQAEADVAAAQSYEGLIRQEIIRNWHRPLSARNGMEALLEVHLLPTGEVHNVTVLKQSGDEAFDRSAVQAVERAEKFEELQQLEPRVFDKHFRRFRMLFKPEDLDR